MGKFWYHKFFFFKKDYWANWANKANKANKANGANKPY